MRKVLAVASVNIEHKKLVLKQLQNIFKKTKISMSQLLQQEIDDQSSNGLNVDPSFKSYPYITLTIPNYEQHREYLEKVYKNNILFSKFILLISSGNNYQELIINRSEDILKEQCRNWNDSVTCDFDSHNVFINIQDQMNKIDKVLGEMDIRGKINQIDAQKRFHLIQDHKPDPIGDQPQKPFLTTKQSLKKLFFGLEIAMAKRRGIMANGGGILISASKKYKYDSEFMESECETLECECENLNQSVNSLGVVVGAMGNGQGQCWWGLPRRMAEKGVLQGGKRRGVQLMASKEAVKNPYRKKQHAHEVVLSQW